MQDKIIKNSNNIAAFGGRLRKFRIEQGLSQAELAQKMGLSHNTLVSRFEKGKALPTAQSLITLAGNCKIDLHWLLVGRPSSAFETLRIYTSSYIAEHYEKISQLKTEQASLKIEQAMGKDCAQQIARLDEKIESLLENGQKLREHLNALLDPIGLGFH